MLRMVAHRIADRRILQLIRRWLRAGVMEGQRWSETVQGTPQGSGITPWTQKITASLSGRSGSGRCVDVCHIWLYSYDKWHASATPAKRSGSITPGGCCSVGTI